MSTRTDRDRARAAAGGAGSADSAHSALRPQHGQRIAREIQETSVEELLVEHGALYPALQRREERGCVSARPGTPSRDHKARFYMLTASGRRQLVRETAKWKRLAPAIGRVLESEAAES